MTPQFFFLRINIFVNIMLSLHCVIKESVYQNDRKVGIQKHNFFILTLKAPITTAADNIHKHFFIVFSEKIRLDVSSESSARQRIHMKNQALFSSEDESKKLKFVCCNFCLGL